MNQHHDTQTTDVTATPAVLPQEQAPGLSRRKFLTRAGVGSLPVIMSIKSGSAWGCVDLKCTPGETSLSNSGSAVASATSTSDGKPAAYKKPKWSTIKIIKDVFSVDFNSYLLETYQYTLYTKSGSKYTEISKSNCKSWWTTVKASTCYTKKSSSNYPRYTGTKREPGMFGTKVLINSTKFSEIFGTGTTANFLTCLSMNDSLEQYLVAAFIGAVWERHTEYRNQYGSRELCYPAPQDLIDAYQDALNRDNGLEDLRTLLKFYTIG
ncbi:hypothetical protein EOE67_04705 [Rheinheimera riviphila]|uniref:Uncharacterized protein n=1 Tax=Rheinheimera riviphila TaxID=1834037 RepID=A0A437R249_9GAMM|nr:hypothetical protein [Rheinheimera riviphila]RVU40879.1 hypothetical protein EOE67_04705 [Rheinheimera riviphila]